MKKQENIPRPFPFKAILVIFVISLFCSLILSYLMVSFSYSGSTVIESRYLVVVPGAGVTRSGKPSLALKKRLDKALEIFNDNKAEKIYISGTRYEVLAMNNYLIAYDVPTDVIILDEQGINTYQTVANISSYFQENHISNSITFVSQRYHLPRIALFARRQNLKNATLIAADHKDVKAKSRSRFILRETLAYFKALWLNH